jgi:tape measure domain-containing protein
MPNQLTYSDFFDFSDDGFVRKVIADLKAMKAAFQEFRQEVGSNYMSMYEKQMKELATEIRRVADASALLNITHQKGQQVLIQQLQLIQKLTAENQALRQSQQGVQAGVKAVADSIDGLTEKLREQTKEWNSLSRSQDMMRRKELAGEIRQTKDQINAMNSALNNSVASTKHAAGSYNALDAETRKLRADMMAMAGGLNATGKNFEELKAKIRANEQQLANFDSSVGKSFRNLKDLGSSTLSYAGKVATAIGVLVGIQSVQELGSKIFNINKNLDALEFTLRSISKTEDEYARNQLFLRKASDDYGLEIQALTDSYSKFYAAGTSANLSAQTTRTIFDQVAQTAGVLHLRQEDVNGVLVAFGQIASKGKVQAEELRGQIGERIPGAFAIAARSMGITTVELNKMLRAGTVMSNEFLPKFAAEMQRTFAGNVPKHIQSLQASVNRLSNEFTVLARSEGLSNFFEGIVSDAASVLRFFNDLSKSTDELISEWRDAQENAQNLEQNLVQLTMKYDDLKGKQNRSKEEQEQLNQVIQDIVNIAPAAADGIDQYGRALDINRGKVQQFIDAQNKFAQAAKTTAQVQLNTEIKKSVDDYQNVVKQISSGRTKTQYDLQGNYKGGDQPIYKADGVSLTKEGEALRKEQQDLISGLGRSLEQAAALNMRIPKEAESILKSWNSVEYEKTKILRGLNEDIRYAESELTKQQINVMKATTKVEKEEMMERVNSLIKMRDEARQKLKDFTDPYSATATTPDTADDGGKAAAKAKAAAEKAQRELEKLIRAREKALEAAANLEIEVQRERMVKGEITEHEFREKQLAIIREFTDKAIKEEMRLGGGADQSKIDDWNAKRQKAETDFTKFLGEEMRARYELRGNQAQEALKLQKDAAQSEKDRIKEIEDEFVKSEERKLKFKLDALTAQYEYENALHGKNYARDLKYFDDTIREKKHAGEDYSNEEQKRRLLEADRQKQITDMEIETRNMALHAAAEIGQELIDGMYEARIASLEKERDYELAMAGNNAAAKRAIDDKFNKQVADQKVKQAKADKIFGLLNVGINTAIGISKTIAEWGMPYAWPFIGMVAAQGLIQATAIALKPIPKYAGGRGKGKAELARINEQGFELVEDNKGYRVENFGRETVTHLKTNDVVHTHERSKTILKTMIEKHESNKFIDSLLEGTNVVRSSESQRDEKLLYAMARIAGRDDITFAFDRSVSKIPVNVTEISERGITQYTIRQGNRIKNMNGRNKLGGDG